MPTTTKAYAITADAVAAETEANGGDIAAIDVSKVVQLDDLELRDKVGEDKITLFRRHGA